MDIQRDGRSVALGALAFASVASHAQTGNPGSPYSENGPEMAQSAQDAATSSGEPTLEGQSPTEVPIVVTGSRLREESVQDTPLAVSVLSEDFVEDLHAPDIQGLSAVVHNLHVTTPGSQPTPPAANHRNFRLDRQ